LPENTLEEYIFSNAAPRYEILCLNIKLLQRLIMSLRKTGLAATASLIPGFEYDICLRNASADKSSSATPEKQQARWMG